MSSSVYILLYSITTQTQNFLCLDNFILILFFWSSNTITISFKTCSKHITDHLLCNNQFFTDHSYKMLRTYSQKILVCVVHLWSWVKTNKNNNFCEKLIINLCKFWTTLYTPMNGLNYPLTNGDISRHHEAILNAKCFSILLQFF